MKTLKCTNFKSNMKRLAIFKPVGLSRVSNYFMHRVDVFLYSNVRYKVYIFMKL